MTALGRNPTNPNLYQSNKFLLSFARAPNLQFFCQTINVPGIATSEVPQTNPFVEIYLPGEKPVYDVLNITFYVDEELTAWREIHDWIRAMTFPFNYDEYKELPQLNSYARSINTRLPQYSDATLTLLTSSNQPNIRFKFYDVFPISVSSFVVSTTESPDSIITADATFRFTIFDVEKVELANNT